MNKTTAGLILVLIAMSVNAFAQDKTVTNADLEKFRVKRLAAQKELRENYAKLGFASPEVQAKIDRESARERAVRAEKYRRLRAEAAMNQARQQPPQNVYYYQQQSPNRGYYLNGYYPSYNRNLYVPTRRRIKRGPGYISNPIIRGAWLRGSSSMRRTYRGNFSKPRPRN